MATRRQAIAPPDLLLERETELAVLRGVLDDAAAGTPQGAVVLVSGEAGSGKSSLVRAWLDEERPRARVLVGWCDDLATARAFAPFHDVADRDERLRVALHSGDAGAVLDAVVALLDDPLQPVVLLVEDVHWADDATLDAIRHVGRRIAGLDSVLVLTYRDDEVGAGHRLVPVLGGLGGARVHRVPVGPLSVDAIARLASGRDVDPAHVARVTGGNAFLATALLSDPDDDVPASVRDVVMGCVARVGSDARELVLALAEVPGVMDTSLVDALAPTPGAVVEAEEIGLLVVDGTHARFRHEIARQAVRDASTGAQRRAGSRRVLDVLLDRTSWTPGDDPGAARDPVRIAHFAAGAGDADVLVAMGPHAASVAHGNGAHDIADRLQRAVLDLAYRLDDDVLAALERERAWTLYSMGQHGAAHDAARRAAATARRTGDDTALVEALVAVARVAYMANEPTDAGQAAREAVAVAERSGDAVLLAVATVTLATHAALVGEEDTVALADVAVANSVAVGRDDLHALALTYRAVGTLHSAGTMADAIDTLEGAVTIARRSGDAEAITRSVLHLLEVLAYAADPRMEGWIATARVMDDGSTSWDGFRAHVELVDAGDHLYRGDFDRAEAVLARMRAAGLAVGVLEVEWLLTRARLSVRRGDADRDRWLDRARAAVRDAGARQFDAWLVVLELEVRWLDGEGLDAADVAAVRAVAPGPAWSGELAIAARRAGASPDTLPQVATGPWAAGAAGDAAASADALKRAGMPYDQALALVDVGDESALRSAVAILDRIGAAPAAALARQRLVDLGVESLPRGPNRATRANPAGLTRRQTEVLGLLVDGRTNAQIAELLILSVRTVEDHVSAVLAKLDVSTREEAAALGRDLLGD